MVSLLVIFLPLAGSPPAERVAATAEARIVVLRPHRAGPESWEPASNPRQREIVLEEKEGATIRVRLTEFE